MPNGLKPAIIGGLLIFRFLTGLGMFVMVQDLPDIGYQQVNK
jgi:hypothetical protein